LEELVQGMKSELIMAVNQICAEKDLPRTVILGAIEEALVHAYRRNHMGTAVPSRVRIDPDTGDLHVVYERRVVETVTDPGTEISLAEARAQNPAIDLDGSVEHEREPTDFGRIAAQTAKQVILQRIHEAERDVLFDSFHQREGELINGTVQSIDYRSNQVTISLGKKAEGILMPEDQLANDRYRIGQTVRALLAEVNKGTRGPQIRLSRTHRNMLRRLLEREVPEIYNGTVEIKSIAREPGQRSKVAVAASQPGVDPVGSCVGMRGTRIQNIVDELNGEKIDVVEWSNDVRQFISNALSPARPTDAVLIEDGEVRTAIVVVPDRQLSLAIGKEGQNARLAAKLTGWRIDIKSETEAATEGLSEMKRQQIQMMKTRSLEAKAAAVPGDDLLSRAEWLLREKDRAAVSLEQMAQMLAQADATSEEAPAEGAESAVETGTPAGEGTVQPTEASGAPGANEDLDRGQEAAAIAPEAAERPEIGELGYEDMGFTEADFIEEGEPDLDAKKPAKKKKAGKKVRQPTQEDWLDQVSRLKGRGGWVDLEDL
jgi:transcription termination/antitermination protein NusA